MTFPPKLHDCWRILYTSAPLRKAFRWCVARHVVLLRVLMLLNLLALATGRLLQAYGPRIAPGLEKYFGEV
jgi:hypothetical protein